MWSPTWYLLFVLITIAHAQQHKRQIDSAVIGDPNIVCEDNEIHVYVKTREAFIGNMYVRSHFADPKCRASFQNNQHSGGLLSVKLGDCGMIRTEQSNPLGTNYRLDVVVSSHPIFETRNDQAYAVGCFYKSEPINLHSEMKINDILPKDQPESFVNGVMENKCDYSIRVESVSGPLVRYTEIGQPVVHRWGCEDKHLGILVKDCVAQSESIYSTQVIDNRGCPVSDFFDKLVYDDELTMAFVRIEAFKFPDVDTIRFACNISFCEKNNGACIGVTPPNCPNVRPSEFRPNSNIDSSVDPTRVYINRNEPLPVGRSPLIQTTRKFFPFQQITTSTHKPFFFLGHPRQKDFVKSEGPEYVEVLPARQYPIIAPISSQPVAQALRSPTDSPSLLLLKKNRTDMPVFRPMSNERNVRARRDDTILNVKAETMFVADPNLSVDGPRKRSIITPNGEGDTGICLNKKASTLLIVCGVLLGIFSFVTTSYIIYDVCSSRHRRIKAQITGRKDAMPEFACSIKAFNSRMLN